MAFENWEYVSVFILSLVGAFEGSDLVISKERFSEHVFSDIREKIQFTWKSGAIRGAIPVSILFPLVQASLL